MRAGLQVIGCAAGLWLGAGAGVAAQGRADLGSYDAPSARSFGGPADARREQVIEAVQKRFNARVVRVVETTVNGRAALELRLLSEQRVWSIVVDAATGQVLSGG